MTLTNGGSTKRWGSMLCWAWRGRRRLLGLSQWSGKRFDFRLRNDFFTGKRKKKNTEYSPRLFTTNVKAVLELAATCLANLSEDEDNGVDMAEEGGVALAVGLAKHRGVRVRREVCRMFRN